LGITGIYIYRPDAFPVTQAAMPEHCEKLKALVLTYELNPQYLSESIFLLLVPAHLGSPRQRAIKRLFVLKHYQRNNQCTILTVM